MVTLTSNSGSDTYGSPRADRRDAAGTIDPIRAYLDQMAEFPLLNRRQELAAAREIERRRRAFQRQLLASDFVLRRLLRLYRDIKSGKQRIDHAFGVSVAHKHRIAQLRAILDVHIPTLARLLEQNDELRRAAPDPNDLWQRKALARRRRKARRLAQELEPRIQWFFLLYSRLEQLASRVAAATSDAQSPRFVRWAGESPERLQRRVERLSELKRQYEESRQFMAAANLRLVVSIARRYQDRGLSLLDLIQEGNLGLIQAVDKFDSTCGCKFSTYAVWWIRQAISLALKSQPRVVRLPVNQLSRLNRILESEEAASHADNAPTIEQIARAKGHSPDEIMTALCALRPVVPLHAPDEAANNASVGDFIEDRREQDPLSALKQSDRGRQVNALIGALDHRERQVISLRFGLKDGKPHTLAEIGALIQLTREGVRLIEARALSKMQARVGEAIRGNAKGGKLLAEMAEEFAFTDCLAATT